MLYIITIFCPPLGVLFTGKIFHFAFSAILLVGTLAFPPIGLFLWIHALAVVSSHYSEKRQKKYFNLNKKLQKKILKEMRR